MCECHNPACVLVWAEQCALRGHFSECGVHPPPPPEAQPAELLLRWPRRQARRKLRSAPPGPTAAP
eukprot:8193054-Alexandrium_andersonii.AAC.1